LFSGIDAHCGATDLCDALVAYINGNWLALSPIKAFTMVDMNQK